MNAPPRVPGRPAIDTTDRRIVAVTQAGLPLDPRPYQAIAEVLGLDAEEVMARLRRLLAIGAVRRIGAVPNHYALGYRANGMSVWDLPDEEASALGRRVGALPFVSHCYRRPRHPPAWPYNLFAMVHGRGRDEVEDKVGRIAALLGPADAPSPVTAADARAAERGRCRTAGSRRGGPATPRGGTGR